MRLRAPHVGAEIRQPTHRDSREGGVRLKQVDGEALTGTDGDRDVETATVAAGDRDVGRWKGDSAGSMDGAGPATMRGCCYRRLGQMAWLVDEGEGDISFKTGDINHLISTHLQDRCMSSDSYDARPHQPSPKLHRLRSHSLRHIIMKSQSDR